MLRVGLDEVDSVGKGSARELEHVWQLVAL